MPSIDPANPLNQPGYTKAPESQPKKELSLEEEIFLNLTEKEIVELGIGTEIDSQKKVMKVFSHSVFKPFRKHLAKFYSSLFAKDKTKTLIKDISKCTKNLSVYSYEEAGAQTNTRIFLEFKHSLGSLIHEAREELGQKEDLLQVGLKLEEKLENNESNQSNQSNLKEIKNKNTKLLQQIGSIQTLLAHCNEFEKIEMNDLFINPRDTSDDINKKFERIKTLDKFFSSFSTLINEHIVINGKRRELPTRGTISTISLVKLRYLAKKVEFLDAKKTVLYEGKFGFGNAAHFIAHLQEGYQTDKTDSGLKFTCNINGQQKQFIFVKNTHRILLQPYSDYMQKKLTGLYINTSSGEITCDRTFADDQSEILEELAKHIAVNPGAKAVVSFEQEGKRNAVDHYESQNPLLDSEGQIEWLQRFLSSPNIDFDKPLSFNFANYINDKILIRKENDVIIVSANTDNGKEDLLKINTKNKTHSWTNDDQIKGNWLRYDCKRAKEFIEEGNLGALLREKYNDDGMSTIKLQLHTHYKEALGKISLKNNGITTLRSTHFPNITFSIQTNKNGEITIMKLKDNQYVSTLDPNNLEDPHLYFCLEERQREEKVMRSFKDSLESIQGKKVSFTIDEEGQNISYICAKTKSGVVIQKKTEHDNAKKTGIYIPDDENKEITGLKNNDKLLEGAKEAIKKEQQNKSVK